MSLPVVLRPLADADVRQVYAELEAQALGLGDKFLDRLQEALDRIEATIFPRRSENRGVRDLTKE